ncbi:MAG: protein kinase [Gemmatimonadaceae bacterium]
MLNAPKPDEPTEGLLIVTAALADRYEIQRELGSGGMATVFAARDLRHQRQVAVKVLHPELGAMLGAPRFLAEIRMTAQLQHPHIMPMYDSGEADGVLYFVMPLIEGESLRQRLAREGRLAVEEAVRLTRQVADALQFAHDRGVIHRDIKPENIMLQAGHALVADFGIGRVVSSNAPGTRLTALGMPLGTPVYMSPEQASASADLDTRSDLYSLGCVLYELLSGEPPFMAATSQGVIMQRFVKPPPSAAARRPGLPMRIDAAVRRAMAFDPRDRFASAREFADALGDTSAPVPVADTGRRSIAVLPFINMSVDADTEFFSDGITEEILNALAKLNGLRVIARTSSFAFKGKNIDIREIGQRLGADVVLEGSVRRSGEQLRITAQLIDATDGHHLWSERYDRDRQDVFRVQDEITSAIRDALSARLLGIGSVQQYDTPNIDMETYELYLRGRFHLNRLADGMHQGMECLQEVIRRAPTFAPAYAQLSMAYGMLTMYCVLPPRTGFPIIRGLCEQAIALDPNLSSAYTGLGHVALWHDWDWKTSRQHFERALSLDSNDALAKAMASQYWFSLGHFEEGDRLCDRAMALDPMNTAIMTVKAIGKYLARDWGETIRITDKIISLDRTSWEAYRWRGYALRESGRLDESLEALERAVQFSNRHPWTLSHLAATLGFLGRMDEAREIEAELKRRAPVENIPPMALPVIAVITHDADTLFASLEASFEFRDFWMVQLRTEPVFDPFRSDPRFDDLIRRVGIPEITS